MEDSKMTFDPVHKTFRIVDGVSVETLLELRELPVVSECQPRYLYRFSAAMHGSDLTAYMEMTCYELQDGEKLINDFLERYRLIAFPKIRSMSNK